MTKLEAKQNILPNIGRLMALLMDISNLLKVYQPSSHAQRIDLVALTRCLAAIRDPIQAMRASGAMINPWMLAGLGRREVRNAAVLAGLWNPAMAGAAAVLYLDAFLRRVERANRIQLPDHAALSQGYVILTEDCAIGQVSERIDLTIEGPDYLIGIEVKVDAGEGQAQLERYRTALAARATSRGPAGGGLTPYLIFLAPRVPSIDDVPVASWRDVAEAARLSAGDRATFFAQLLDAFADHVEHF